MLLASLNLHCSLSDKPPQNTDETGKADVTKIPQLRLIPKSSPAKPTNVTFDLKAFQEEVQQKLSQVGMTEEELRTQFDLLNTKAMAYMKTIKQQLEDLFSDPMLTPEQIIHRSEQIIDGIEPETKKMINTSFLSQHFDADTLNKMTYPSVLEEQRRAQRIVRGFMTDHVENKLNTLLDQIGTIERPLTRHADRTIQKLLPFTGPYTPQSLFEEEITKPAKEALKDSYNRTELGLLKDPGLMKEPVGEVYQFQSVEQVSASDLQANPQPHKFVRVYDKLWHSFPFHEQGILSRKCGLEALEAADQAMLKSLISTADILYLAASAFEEMVTFGILPNDTGRSIYELCTGRNLLTGTLLTNEDILNLPIEESYFNEQNEGTFFTKSDITNALKEINVLPNATASN